MSSLGGHILIVQTGFHQPLQKRAQSFKINCGYPCLILRLLKGNVFATNAESNCFIYRVKENMPLFASRFMKMRFKHHGKNSRKHMMEEDEEGLMHMMKMSVDHAGLHSLSSQGKPQNTHTLVIIDRQRNDLK